MSNANNQSDEIKRAAEKIARDIQFNFIEAVDAGDLKPGFSMQHAITKALLSERRRAYEECLQIANMVPLEEQHIPAGNYSAKGMSGLVKVVRHGIVNEIRRRMEGV